MEEIFTSPSDSSATGQSGDPTSDTLQLSSKKEPDAVFDTRLSSLLDQQLVYPKQESIDKILRYSRSL